jgi:RNA polymerase sigma-70 factor (ECF subfamily)
MPVFRDHPELLSPFREGQPAALDRVYRFYVRSVDKYARTLARSSNIPELGQASAVGDLIQDVFIRAFSDSARGSYDGLREYGPYLMTIARNCFIDGVRARGREVLKAPEELAQDADDVIPSSRRSADPAVMAVLQTYLNGLSSELRGVYEQRFVVGNSQDEASAVLGISRRAVRTGEVRLRSGLRKALQSAGISLRVLSGEACEFSTGLRPYPVHVEGEP